MPVEERVVIHVDIDTDIDKDLSRIEQRLKALEKRTNGLDDSNRDLNKTLKKTDDKTKSLTKSMAGFGLTSKVVGPLLTMLKVGFAAVTIQTGLFAAALLTAKLALLTGRAAASGYQLALKGISVAAAGAATAISVVAASLRQYAEVSNGVLVGPGAKGRTGAAQVSRGITSQTRGLLGGESAAKIARSLIDAGVRGGGRAGGTASGIFNISGGNAAAAEAIAAALASGDFKEARSAVTGADGFRKGSLAGAESIDDILKALESGGAVSKAFSNLGEDLSGTMIGTLKTQFVSITDLFANVGEPLLAPFRDTFLEISHILKQDVMSMATLVQEFGADSFAPTLVTTVDKVSGFIRDNIIGNMDDVTTMGETFVQWFKDAGDFFKGIGNWLVGMEPAADALIDFFKVIGGEVADHHLFKDFQSLLTTNTGPLTALGESIGGLVNSLLDLLGGGQGGLFDKMDLFSDTIDAVADKLIPSISEIFNAMSPILDNLPGAIETLASVLNMLAPTLETLVSAINGLIGLMGPMSGVGSLAMVGSMMAMKNAGASGTASFFKNMRGKVAASGGLGATLKGMFGRGGTAAVGSQGFHGYEAGAMMAGSAIPGRGGMAGGISKFAKAHPLMLGVGGAMVGGDAILDSYRQGGDIGNHAQAALGGAAAGAALGTALGGPVLGTAIGAALGASLSVGLGMMGDKRKKERTGRAIEADTERLDELTSTTSDSMQVLQTEFSLLSEAMSSGDGDSDIFGQYLSRLGINPDDVNRDDIFESHLKADTLGQLEHKIEEGLAEYQGAVDFFSDGLGVSAEEVKSKAEEMGINLRDLDNLSNIAAATLAAAIHDIPDRNQVFAPMFDGGPTAGEHAMLAGQESLDALLSQKGKVPLELLKEASANFLNSEVLLGNNPDMAGFGSIQELQRAAGFMERGGNMEGATQIRGEIAAELPRMFEEMGESYGIQASVLENAFTNKKGQFRTGNLDETVGDIDRYRDALSGQGDLNAAGRVRAIGEMEPEVAEGIGEALGAKLVSLGIIEPGKGENLPPVNQAALLDSRGGEGTADKVIDEFLVRSDVWGEKQETGNALLKDIKALIPEISNDVLVKVYAEQGIDIEESIIQGVARFQTALAFGDNSGGRDGSMPSMKGSSDN